MADVPVPKHTLAETGGLDIAKMVGQLRDVRHSWRRSQGHAGEFGAHGFPSRQVVGQIIDVLSAALFPLRLGPPDLKMHDEDAFVHASLQSVSRTDPTIVTVADACATQRAEEDHPVLRLFAETRYAAKSSKHQRRVVARIEASTMGMDIRTVITSLTAPGPEDLYEVQYHARGNAENLIKLHKSQLSSDRTSCQSANSNQMRLILHTAAYWLMWRVQQAFPKKAALATAEFATMRVRLLKIAAHVIETSTRIRGDFASACPYADLLRTIANSLKPAPA